jgi:hypothetical protein
MRGVYAYKLCNLFSFATWSQSADPILIYNSMKFKLKSYTASYAYKLCNLFSFATWRQRADIISKEIILCVAYMHPNCAIYSLLRLGVKVPTLSQKK